ncbi:Choline/carnitine acyltransferase domain-containing protein [Caenorhabditis elegans]|uniref:Choline/carnitine acyltransferase domain-containing protein n=1 Tax=Caenorhabditis elegans TaxID=6239 RepID=Q20278_CAEEL|nr:Choline/carnitine acyltransferase domain-containing protein [Caenorhabditis elegans]CAA92129.3 Choline/carnitine acyltransferase domain-containing protein [Caenorhabditis elegans]
MTSSTFSEQNSLPSLPLPELEETIGKYLKSLVPIVPKDELETITTLANDFASSQNGQILQRFLKEKTISSKNWLEDWWYDAYLTNRDSLLTQNMGAVVPKFSVNDSSQIESASHIIHHLMSYWSLIRQEKIEVTKSRGNSWDMNQDYNLFNACRVPALPKDRIKRYFRTEAEGKCPSHVIILCNGHVWKLETTCENSKFLNIFEIQNALKRIKESSRTSVECSIVQLTSLGRDNWAQIRESMIQNSNRNVELFHDVDSAVFCLTLSDDFVENESELMKYSIFGSPLNAYCDKNLNIIVLRDGKTCLQAEHGNVDAISLFAPCDFAADQFQLNRKLSKKSSQNKSSSMQPVMPVKIEFLLTGSVSQKISEAERDFYFLSSKTNVNVYHYTNFGATYCKQRTLYADTIIQIALQMAYLKTHNKLAPTYETASTRMFYHGRTETVRSLTTDMEKYLTACENSATNETLKLLFFDAYNSHNTLMDAAREGKGIDRHFYGLRKAQTAIQSYGKSVEIPFLDHKSFSASGGNGNFLLSTSFLGYHENGCFGYVVPMCKDGYGTFYRINKTSFTFTISNWLDDATNGDEFRENLEYSLNFIKNVILTNE